jgi:hypothetical protein
VAVFSRYVEAIQWAEGRLVRAHGPVARKSDTFDFSETDYYEPTMGSGLKKIFLAFDRPFDPARLVDVKLQTNDWEREYAELGRHVEARPLNVDPGYLTLGKLVLASTKDFTHRVYLDRGIYAEVTLYYKHDRWRHHEWTFPDYRREDYQRFFSECRRWVSAHRRKECNA